MALGRRDIDSLSDSELDDLYPRDRHPSPTVGRGSHDRSSYAFQAALHNGAFVDPCAVAAASSGAVVTVTVTVNDSGNREFVREDLRDQKTITPFRCRPDP